MMPFLETGAKKLVTHLIPSWCEKSVLYSSNFILLRPFRFPRTLFLKRLFRHAEGLTEMSVSCAEFDNKLRKAERLVQFRAAKISTQEQI
jgi:hypothetical protein